MAKQLQLRRGTTAEHASFTGAVGEVTVDSDKDIIVVHDGYTVGGIPMLRQDVNNLADQTIPTNKIIKGTANQVLVTNPAGTGVEFAYKGVLQVIANRWTTQGSFSVSGSADSQVPYSSISITPKASGSKIYIMYRIFGEISNNWNTVFNIRKNGNRINSAAADNTVGYGQSMASVTYGQADNDSSTPEIVFMSTLDDSGSTVAGTAITYDLSCTGGSTMWYNRCFTGGEYGVSEVIVWEIA